MTSSHGPYDSISPLDYRYLASTDPAVADIRTLLTEETLIRYMASVESVLASSIADLGLVPRAVAEAIELASAAVTAADVYEEEKRIGHATRALVNCIRSRLRPDEARYVHLFATSSDIIDTANAIRYRDFCLRVLIPELSTFATTLADIVDDHADTKQIGRTHGMFAEPLTFGLAIAYHLDRLTSRTWFILDAALAVTGKLSGAVGAYNSMALAWPDSPSLLEDTFLQRLGLPSPKPGVSTQISQPEPVTDLAYGAITCLSVIANVADDMRHLHRSEIAEVREASSEERVGSSTMPHKHNPTTFEGIKSLWKEFSPRIITLLADQISEHQRDLTNSASSRFTPEILGALAYASRKMTTAMRGLTVDADRMAENLASAVPEISSEPLYVALSLAGLDDAYEAVRRVMKIARRDSRDLLDVARADDELRPILAGLPDQTREILADPSQYVGHAPALARMTAETCRERTRTLAERLKGLGLPTSTT